MRRPTKSDRDSVPRKQLSLPERLLLLVKEVCAKSDDNSCYASVATLAKRLKTGPVQVHHAKWKLINDGKLNLDLRSNRNRPNPRHRLTIPARKAPARPALNAFLKSRLSLPSLVGLSLWGEMPRLDLIDCYLKSGWQITPLVPFGKLPVAGMTREKLATINRDGLIDMFYHQPELNVGLWIEQYTVFDYDSDRQPENTLTAIRGEHSHNYFIAHPDIYNTAKDIAPDIDTKAPGGLVVLPPSIHRTGQPYQWGNLRTPAPVPDKLIKLWHQRRTIGGPSGFKLDTLPSVIYKGERDNYLWAFGRSLRAAGVPFEQIDMQLRAMNRERLKPQYSERELDKKINHVWNHRNDPKKWIQA